jgi:hypothetical protein
MSFTILIMTLTTFSLGSYFYCDHYIYSPSPNDHFRVAISLFYKIDKSPDLDTPANIKEKINDVVGSTIKVAILDPPAIMNSDDAILRGKKMVQPFVYMEELMKQY